MFFTMILARVGRALPVIKKYRRAAAVIVLIVAAAWFVTSAKKSAYRAGYNDATAKISAEIASNIKKNAETAHKASADYQQIKSENKQKERVRYVQVQKVIKRPVYINRCIDDDGLQIINNSARGR